MHNMTLKDIAKKLKLSEATISLALNDRPNVNLKTKKRVLDYVREIGYTANPLARGLAMQKTMTIGLVCPDTENPYYGSYVKHISNYCSQYEYSLVLSSSNNDLHQEANIIKNFIEKKFDGIIVMPLDLKSNDLPAFSMLIERDVPFVFCTSYYEGFADNCVLTDYADGSYQLTRYLLEHGHRELWYLVTRDQTIPVTKDRLDGYKKAYEDLHIPFNPEWIIGCDIINSKNGYDITNQLIASRSLPDGILALNDYMAFGVMRALQENGKNIPEDISVAGYDDVFYSRIAGIPLTTVRQDLDVISMHCVNMLLKKIDGSFEPKQSLPDSIKPTLVIRNTTRDRREIQSK